MLDWLDALPAWAHGLWTFTVILGSVSLMLAILLFRRARRNKSGNKMRAKVVKAENGCVTLCIDGEYYNYLVARPTPLAAGDLKLVGQAFDNSLLQSLCLEGIQEPVPPMTRMWNRLMTSCRKRESVVFVPSRAFCESIRQCGVSLDIDGTACYVVPSDVLDALERGKLDGQV